MDRLTNRDCNGEAYIFDDVLSYQAIDKLAAYEDAEEHGRLIILPCKVGDTVWVHEEKINSYFEVCKFAEKKKVIGFKIDKEGLLVIACDDIFGWESRPLHPQQVYNTREEAEAALGGDGT